MSQKIGVVGAGICGLTIGRFLRKQGYDVTLFDLSDNALDSGSGILIAPNGMRVLQELGLATDVVKAGSIITSGGLKAANGSFYTRLTPKFAWVLALEISKHGCGPEAFRPYQQRRIGRTSSINKMSYRIGQIGHVKNPFGLWLRSLILKMSPDQTGQLGKLYNAEL